MARGLVRERRGPGLALALGLALIAAGAARGLVPGSARSSGVLGSIARPVQATDREVVPIDAPAAGEREALRVPLPVLPATKEVAAQADPTPVRVHGRLLRWGRGVAFHDLTFRRREARPGLEEWDFTRADGAFDVDLVPGEYLILAGDPARPLGPLEVPADASEMELVLGL